MRRAPTRFSDAEMRWLRANHMMVLGEYARAFNVAFGRQVTTETLNGVRKRNGWKVGRDSSRYKGINKGKYRAFSAREVEWVCANGAMVAGDLRAAFVAEFGRSDVTVDQITSLRKRQGCVTGRNGRFVKGQPSPNKGKPCPPGKMGNHPNARRTQFKKGCPRGGAAAKIYQPIGTEKLRSDGYLYRKIRDTGPMHLRWRASHLVEWEKLNGPVPKGMCLKSRDGNRQNIDPGNWQLIPRGVLSALNMGKRFKGIDHDTAPPELRPAILMIAKLKHQAGAQAKRRAA